METRKLSELRANPLNPRGEVTHDVSLRELAMSIKAQGVLQPVLITPAGLIVAGHRRVEAAKLADLSEVPVIVRELNDAEQLQVMLVENLQRNDLTLMQTARAYRTLTERGLSVPVIAQSIGVTKRSVNEHLMVFKLPTELLDYFERGILGLRVIPCLIDLSSEDQLRIGREAAQEGWGEIKVKTAIHRLKGNASAASPQAEPQSPSVSGNGHLGTKRPHLERIWDRVEDGCYDAESVQVCSECGRKIFPHLTMENIRGYLQQLVDEGRAEWRRQRQQDDSLQGLETRICVPADMPSGSDLGKGRRMVD